jgi:hypothetical protein
MAAPLRLSEYPRETWTMKLAFRAHRLLAYGVLGVFLEILFYPLVRVGQTVPVLKYFFMFDWKVDSRLGLDGPWHVPLRTLFGQSSLWMFPIYILSALAIETAYRKWLFMRHFVIRALCYGVIILACEWGTGFAVKAITCYAIWTYTDCLNIMKMTTLAILPMWIVAGFLIELIYRELMDPKDRRGLEDELEKRQRRS